MSLYESRPESRRYVIEAQLSFSDPDLALTAVQRHIAEAQQRRTQLEERYEEFSPAVTRAQDWQMRDEIQQAKEDEYHWSFTQMQVEKANLPVIREVAEQERFELLNALAQLDNPTQE